MRNAVLVSVCPLSQAGWAPGGAGGDGMEGRGLLVVGFTLEDDAGFGRDAEGP